VNMIVASMSDTNQAKADLQDTTAIVDPLEDTTNGNAHGLSELGDYLAEVDSVNQTVEVEEPDQGVVPDEFEDEPEQVAEEQEQEEEPEEEQEQEESEETPTNASSRFRIRAKDDLEAEALSLRKRHPEWSLEKCLQSAKSILGVDEQPTQQTQSTEPVDTVEIVSKQIKSLIEREQQALVALEFDEVATVRAELEELRDKRENLRIVEAQAKVVAEHTARAQFDAAYSESERKTVAFYPDTAKADSAIVKRMVQLDAQMAKLGDPIYNSPEKPFILAKMAAAELGIPMKQSSTKAKVQPSKSSPIEPASGNARTTAQAPTAKLDERLKQVETVEDYEALVGSL
jgi:hypothetical protein